MSKSASGARIVTVAVSLTVGLDRSSVALPRAAGAVSLAVAITSIGGQMAPRAGNRHCAATKAARPFATGTAHSRNILPTVLTPHDQVTPCAGNRDIGPLARASTANRAELYPACRL